LNYPTVAEFEENGVGLSLKRKTIEKAAIKLYSQTVSVRYAASCRHS
jgi:hypothetical protein